MSPLNTLTTSAIGNRFMFTGREYIQEIGLYDYRNRIYSQNLGRFLQTDPIRANWGTSRDPLGERGGLNLYDYVLNDPVNLLDPDGRNPVAALWHYMTGGGTPMPLTPDLVNSLNSLQKAHPFPETGPSNCHSKDNEVNLDASDYWSWSHPLDSLNVGLTLGQFRYTNDGTTTTISDTYAFPTTNDNHWGGTDHHSAPLSVIPGTPYQESGSYATPH